MKFKTQKFVSLCLMAGIGMAISSCSMGPAVIEGSNSEANVSLEDKAKNRLEDIGPLQVIRYKYEHSGSPKNYSESEIKKALLEAASIWKGACGVSFEEINAKSLNTELNTGLSFNSNINGGQINNDPGQARPIGTVKWTTMKQDAAATATLGSSSSPAYNFTMSLKSVELRSLKGGVNNLKWIFVHEMGHVIGLNHNAQKESVMNVKSLRTQDKILALRDEIECQNLKKGWKT